MIDNNSFCSIGQTARRGARLGAALVAAWLALLLTATAGCDQTNKTSVIAVKPAAPVAAPAPQAVEEPNTPNDYWEAVFLQGSKVGFGHTTITPIVEAGEPVHRIEAYTRFTVKRAHQPTTQEITTTSFETPAGKLLRYHSVMLQGSEPIITVGVVEKDKLIVKTTTAGKTAELTAPWSHDLGGLLAVRQSLQREPMKPGEKRTVRGLVLPFNQVAAVELVAGAYEMVPLLNQSQELLKISSKLILPENREFSGAIFTDRQGLVHKEIGDAMKQEVFRTTKALALSEDKPATFDLVLDNTVRVNRQLLKPHASKKIRYLVQLASGDPSQVFVNDATQEVKMIDPHTAQITVQRALGQPPKPADMHNPPPTADDRGPNNLVQSDHAQVVKHAQAIAQDEADPVKLAAALESYVHRSIRVKGFSKAFATAAEVAETLEGDCTEHAVFLAALARARGMPSRVVIGLVYVPDDQGFNYHMWNELWLGDRWAPYDATLGKNGIGAAHLKLAVTSLKDSTAYNSFLPVAQVMGQLKLEIQEVEN